jgi:hypothetical protein
MRVRTGTFITNITAYQVFTPIGNSQVTLSDFQKSKINERDINGDIADISEFKLVFNPKGTRNPIH